MKKDASKRPGHRAPPGYDASKYERASLGADVVILCWRDRRLEALLIERRRDPYAGCWALPGGFMEMRETLPQAAAREAAEETGLQRLRLYPVGVFSDPERDPRRRVISVAYLAAVRVNKVRVRAGDDAKRAEWFPLERLPELAFDHDRIAAAAQVRLRELAAFTPIMFSLLPRAFTLNELSRLGAAIGGRPWAEDRLKKRAPRIAGLSPAGMAGTGETFYRFQPKLYRAEDFLGLFFSLNPRGAP